MNTRVPARGGGGAAANGVPPPPTFTDSGIAAIAYRIQDRSKQFDLEQEKLAATRNQFEYQQGVLQQEKDYSTKERQKLLKSVRNASSVELEYLNIQEQMTKCQEQTATLLAESETVEEELRADQEAWHANVLESLYAPHWTKQQLYLKHLQAAIATRQNAKADRERRLQFLRDEADRFESERDWVLQQQAQVESDMLRLAQQEEEENRRIEAMAEQVRTSIQKRSTLRNSLREVKDANQKANDEAYKVEQEYMALKGNNKRG